LLKLCHAAGFNMVCCCIGERVAGKLSLRIQQLDVMCVTLYLCTRSSYSSIIAHPEFERGLA